MEELKWYEKLKQQCPTCKAYGTFSFGGESDTHYWKLCVACGFSRSHETVFAEYRHIEGRVFLRSNKYKEFTEVEVAENKKGGIKIRAVPQQKTYGIQR